MNSLIGPLEEQFLIAFTTMQGGTASELTKFVEERTGKTFEPGPLYVTLNRMEKKGLLTFTAKAAETKTGPRHSKSYAVSKKGIKALSDAEEARQRLRPLAPDTPTPNTQEGQ